VPLSQAGAVTPSPARSTTALAPMEWGVLT